MATDVEEYNNRRDQRGGYPEVSELSIEVIYEQFFPTAYNMVESILCGSDTGYSYECKTSELTANDATLASDYVFVNGSGSSVVVTVVIKDADGDTISEIKGNRIDYKADHLTTISGNFLTAEKGGISIDTDWGEDINVEF